MNNDNFNDKFYFDMGYYHTNVLEFIEDDKDEEKFYQSLLYLLKDGETLFIYDDCTTDQSTGFIVYKQNNKLLSEYIFKEDGYFEFHSSHLVWSYPGFAEFTNDEFITFYHKLNNYITINELPIKIILSKTQKRVIERPVTENYHKLSQKEVKTVIRLAYFWRYGIIFIMIVLPFIVSLITGDKNHFILVFSLGSLILGTYYGIGTIYKFRHMYCVYQNANHKKMTPNDINWNSLSKTDIYGLPLIFIGFGVIGVILSILDMVNII